MRLHMKAVLGAQHARFALTKLNDSFQGMPGKEIGPGEGQGTEDNDHVFQHTQKTYRKSTCCTQ
jgi:hypothetical protein